MTTITTKDGTRIFYKDWGSGQPIVFSHGWPLSADAWDEQRFFFASNGFRAIAHDRRGHGRSSQPWNGNDMDTYAASRSVQLGCPGIREGLVPRLSLVRRLIESPTRQAPMAAPEHENRGSLQQRPRLGAPTRAPWRPT
jgi:hypothetical protein